MNLPDQIPKRLRDSAISLPEFDDSEGAWPQKDAVAVIESLEDTNISISAVIILNMTPRGYTQSDPGLLIHRFHNEADSEYSERSRSVALDYIRSTEAVNDKTLFVLTFPLWKDAA